MRTKRDENELPKTMFGQQVQECIDERNWSIRDFAEKADMTYEYARKIVRGQSLPSKYMLKVIVKTLDLNQTEMEKMMVADHIKEKFGKIPALLAGKNPELEPFERQWDILSEDQKDILLAQLSGFAEQNKRRKRAEEMLH